MPRIRFLALGTMILAGSLFNTPTEARHRHPRFSVRVYGGYGWGSPYPYRYFQPVYPVAPPPYYRPVAPSHALLDTDISPEEARVYLDGEAIGDADDFDGFPDYLEIAPGRHVLEFRHPGYRTLRVDLTARRGRLYELDRELRRGNARRSDHLTLGERPRPGERFPGEPPRRRYQLEERRPGPEERNLPPGDLDREPDEDGDFPPPDRDSEGTDEPDDLPPADLDREAPDEESDLPQPDPDSDTPDEEGDLPPAELDREAPDDDPDMTEPQLELEGPTPSPPDEIDDEPVLSDVEDPFDEADVADGARLLLRLRPQDAAVYIDGKFFGAGDSIEAPEGLELDPGSHTIVVVKPGFQTYRTTIVLGKGDRRALTVALENDGEPE